LIVYGINQAITIRRWVAQGEPSIGLSLFIYAFMGMAVYNYSNSQFSNGLRKWEKLAPIAIGFLLAIAFIDFLTNSVQLGLISAIFADWQHLLAFGFGVVAFHFQKIQNRA
jgi:membrane associated rhomboid family serine protease